jgi:hypothetical protein
MAAWYDFIDRLVAHGPLLVNEGEDAVALWDRGDAGVLQLMLSTAATNRPINAVEELHEEVGGAAAGALRVSDSFTVNRTRIA